MDVQVSVLRKLIPPKGWKMPAAIVGGVIVGLLIDLFYVSNAASYLSDDPATCMNCHVMGPQHASWRNSSHREHATCNDCHVPHDSVVNKYLFKAKDGIRHASLFTIRGKNQHQTVQMLEAGQKVVQQNCLRCHAQHLGDTHLVSPEGTDRNCWECHRQVPHGDVRSLSANHKANTSLMKTEIADWLKKKQEKL